MTGYDGGADAELEVALDGLRYSWNGSGTVNVWRQDTGGRWVNFDCFTWADERGRAEVMALIEGHHEDMKLTHADPRYFEDEPTRLFLVGGYDRKRGRR